MPEVVISDNELGATHPELARQFEAEIRAAAQELGWSGACRIAVERSGDGALERVAIVLTRDDAAIEWRVSLPAVAGDVQRAAESAILGRRNRHERRRPARAAADRRGR